MIKDLEIKTSLTFTLAFPSNKILSYFFLSLFYLIADLKFLIPPVIAKIFIHTPELAIPTEMPTNEANIEIETQTEPLKLKYVSA